MKESFIIIGANYGIATFLDVKTKTLLNLAKFESIENIRVTWHSQMLIRIDLDLFDSNSLNNEIIHKASYEDECFICFEQSAITSIFLRFRRSRLDS